MARASVILEDVSVEFPVYGSHRSLRKTLFDRATGGLVKLGEGRHRDRFIVKALTGISLKLEEGDRLGLIGHNGAGKSTLLKVIAGVYEPVAGRVLISGTVTPLFDTMPGFDGEDSGYENIMTAGLLLGMSRREIESKIPDIEEFSELGEYLSLPVRTYSAGMSTRLGFALATAMEPGILLIDEGIGGGDARFAERATKRMKSFIGRSRIMVLASHAEEMIKMACNKAALMEGGRLIACGDINDVLNQYHAMVHGTPAPIVHS